MRCKTLTAIYKNEINTLKKLYEIDFLIHKSVRIHIEQFTVRKIEIDFTSEQLVDDLIAVLTKVERLLMLFDGYFMNLISIEFQDSAGCVPPNLKECAEHFMRRRLAYFHSNKILFSSNYLLDFSKVLTPASDGEKLYVSIQVVDSNTSSSHWEVRCLDLSNGESSVIYTTDQYGERIFGAYANNLVIEEVTDTNRSYYTLDVITKQKSAPIYSYNYNDETRTELVNSKYVYSLRYDHEDLFSLFSIDLDTGVEKCIASNIVIYNTDSTNLSGFFDNHAIIETSDTRDTSNISHIQYNIDLSTGDCVTNTLQYTVDGDEKNVYILAETSDAFLVRNGVEEKEITVVDNTGVPSSLMASIPQYALIQKSDYWNGVSAYTPINDAL